MKKSPKFALIAVVAVLLVLTVIGVSVSFAVNSFISSIDDLEDKWGSLIDVESDPEDGSDTGDQDSENVGGSENGSGVEKTKFTFADGDIIVGASRGQGSNAGKYLLAFLCDDLKPNTKYSIRWSFGNRIEDTPADFLTATYDNQIHYEYYIQKDSAGSNTTYVRKTSKGAMLNGDVATSTDENGYLAFFTHIVVANSMEECAPIKDQYLMHVNYIEFVEVTS